MNIVLLSNFTGVLVFDYPLSHVEAPGVVISSKDALEVINYAISDDKPVASIKFKQTILGSKAASIVSLTSSRGPSPSYPGVLKPDVMAPGSHVLSAWIPSLNKLDTTGPRTVFYNDFNLLSGTSVACAHASGMAALLKGVHPEWSPAAIRSAMITTANPLDNTFNPIRDYGNNLQFAFPLAIGAGQIDSNRALDPGLIYDATPQDYVNLLCSTNFTKKQILAIINTNKYDCPRAYYDLNYPSFIALYHDHAKWMDQKYTRTLTNVGESVVTYKAMVTAPNFSEVVVSPNVLVFMKKHERKSYNLTIKYKGNMERRVSSGSLVWVEDNGKHTVRSPIVVSPLVFA
ncbi:Subtilisin-like protease [Morus notabilis]|uniref:Subtilisin-like protease n=1 Tax=Morus notabilis TaxID=981085 RepID=W9SY92_9ROSA|nr:Subtilisin-like protease [Morus notabilis]